MNTSDEQNARHSGIQVIARAGSIMRALGNNPRGLSLAAIAQAVDLPRSTVQRIINALLEEQLVEALGPNGGYRLGPALGQLINHSKSDIISLVQPFMIELSEQLQESTCLSHLVGDKISVINRHIAERELRVVFPIGTQAPAFASSAGRMLLAGKDEHTIGQLYQEPLPQFTDKTPDLAALQVQLQSARRDGYNIDYDEYILGVSSFSVTLHTYMGLYALTVVVPSARANRAAEIIAALQSSKAKVESTIGAAGQD